MLPAPRHLRGVIAAPAASLVSIRGVSHEVVVWQRVALALEGAIVDSAVVDCNVLVRDAMIGSISGQIYLGAVDGIGGILTLMLVEASVDDVLRIAPIEARQLVFQVQMDTDWLTSGHRRDIRDTIASLSVSSDLRDIAIRLVGTAADSAGRALSNPIDARVVRRFHDVVVLLKLKYLRLKPSALFLMILIGKLEVVISLFNLVELNSDLLVQTADLLALLVPALQLLLQPIPLLLQFLDHGQFLS